MDSPSGRLLIVCDVVVLASTYAAAFRLFGHLGHGYPGSFGSFEHYVWHLWLILPTWTFMLRRAGLYSVTSHQPGERFLWGLTKAQALSGLVLLSAMYLTKSENISRLFLSTFLAASFVALAAGRLSAKTLQDYLASRPSERKRRVLIIGNKVAGERYVRLVQNSFPGADVVDVLSHTVKARAAVGQRFGVGQFEVWSEVLRQYVVDDVIAVSPWERASATASLAAACTERGINFRILTEMPPAKVGRYHIQDFGEGIFLVSLEAVPHDALRLSVKRLIDIAGAVAGLVLFGIAHLAYAKRIRRESPGPVLFRQLRVGRNGRSFTLHKFRTMYPDAERKLKELLPRNDMRGLVFKMKADPRVTPTGRILRRRYLDELPQFWNVLRGDMSLVGTRPPTPEEVAQYQNHHYRRLSMKPGVTGLWQITGNGAVTDFEEVVRLDCEYIDNWSLGLDLKIIAKTVAKIAKGTGW